MSLPTTKRLYVEGHCKSLGYVVTLEYSKPGEYVRTYQNVRKARAVVARFNRMQAFKGN